MSKRIKEIPKKQLINMKKFLRDYLGAPPYKGEEKLTHNLLTFHLRENGIVIPKRLSFKEITEEDLRKGRVIYVRDKKGYIIPYVNPHYISEDLLSRHLESKNKEELEAIRKKLLKEELEKRKRILSEKKYTIEEEILSTEELYYEELEEKYNAKYKAKKQKKKMLYISKIKYNRR